jgi:hypothetical protein
MLLASCDQDDGLVGSHAYGVVGKWLEMIVIFADRLMAGIEL